MMRLPRCSYIWLVLVLSWTGFIGTATQATPASPKTAFPKVASPKTVLDYFLLLPQNEYFENPEIDRKKWLDESKGKAPGSSVVDLQNDYLLFTGDGDQPTLTVALFRHQGKVVVAVHSGGEDAVKIDFLRYERGRWKNVTKQALPTANARYDYQLPRYGTTIEVRLANWDWKLDKPISNAGKRVCDLVWRGGKFHVKR